MSTAFRVVLEGAQENPPSASTASGLGTVIFDSTEVAADYSFRIQGLDFGLATGGPAQTPDTADDATRSHFHNAVGFANGPIVFGQIDPEHDPEDVAVVLNADGSWTISGRWETTDMLAPRSINDSPPFSVRPRSDRTSRSTSIFTRPRTPEVRSEGSWSPSPMTRTTS